MKVIVTCNRLNEVYYSLMLTLHFRIKIKRLFMHFFKISIESKFKMNHAIMLRINDLSLWRCNINNFQRIFIKSHQWRLSKIVRFDYFIRLSVLFSIKPKFLFFVILDFKIILHLLNYF